jgi:hypothetical protein
MPFFRKFRLGSPQPRCETSRPNHQCASKTHNHTQHDAKRGPQTHGTTKRISSIQARVAAFRATRKPSLHECAPLDVPELVALQLRRLELFALRSIKNNTRISA